MVGCSQVAWSGKPPGQSLVAEEYIGLHEYQDRKIIQSLTGVDPVRTEWCAAFVNAILEIEGISNNNFHKYPLLARSFLDWGVVIESSDIQRGDIVVFPRGNSSWQGHVGFYVTTVDTQNGERWAILGGNQSNSVRYDLYDPNKALGIRRGHTPVQVRGSLPPWLAKY